MLSVLEIVFPTQEFVIGFDGMDCWDIVEARGIPTIHSIKANKEFFCWKHNF